MPRALKFLFSVTGVSLSLSVSGEYADWEEALYDGAREAEVLALAEQDDSDSSELVEAAYALGYNADNQNSIAFEDPIVEVIDGRTYVIESVWLGPEDE